jgi:hypothetical protein
MQKRSGYSAIGRAGKGYPPAPMMVDAYDSKVATEKLFADYSTKLKIFAFFSFILGRF